MIEESAANGVDAMTDTTVTPEVAGNKVAQSEDPSDPDMTHQAVIQLAKLMMAEVAVKEHLKEILDRELGGRITQETFGSVGKRLGDYIGDDITYWLFALLTTDQPDQWIQWAEETEGVDNVPQIIDFVRWLRAIYGPALSDAYNFWQEPEDSWMRVDRRVDFDQIAQSWIIQIEITKYNGEAMKVSGSPASILNLTRYFVATLNQLPDPAPFTPETSQRLFDEVEVLRTRLPSDSAAPSADAATQPEATAAPP